jgi:hypothetical protein
LTIGRCIERQKIHKDVSFVRGESSGYQMGTDIIDDLSAIGALRPAAVTFASLCLSLCPLMRIVVYPTKDQYGYEIRYV